MPKMKTKETKIEQGSGNVFKDLEHPDADAHLLKAALVTRITKDVFPTAPKAGQIGLDPGHYQKRLHRQFTPYGTTRFSLNC